ncbi:homoserine kinase, partial [Lentibacillus halophilus]
MKSFRISVPASSANIGPGFDSLGVALNLYLTVDVWDTGKWEIEQRSEHLSADEKVEDNYILQIARQTAARYHRKLPACKLVINSDIPLARGLGSSASAIIAGIELADQLCELSLSPDEKLAFGNDIEGHPDNIAPALFGGLAATTVVDGTVQWVRISDIAADVIVYIPADDLKTEAARQVLPKTFPRADATKASSVSNVLIAALLSGDLALAGKMMEADLFHEPYRADLIPHYRDIKEHASRNGAFGTVISGAGPTMLSLFPKGEAGTSMHRLEKLFSEHVMKLLTIDQAGTQITPIHSRQYTGKSH